MTVENLNSLPWTLVTRQMCQSGNPLKGKHLYFPCSEFDAMNRTTFYPPAFEAETVVFDRNNSNNLYFSFSFGCKKTYPKLRTVFILSHPGDTQKAFLRKDLNVYVPAGFANLWKNDNQVKALSESQCTRILFAIEGRLTWQTKIRLVNAQLITESLGSERLRTKRLSDRRD